MSSLEARYSIGRSALFLAAGVATIAANAALYIWARLHFPALWFLGGFIALASLRGLDRRVKLRIAPEGLWYAPWGSQPIQWGELERVSVFTERKFSFLELHPKHPDVLRSRLPWLTRLNSSANARFGKPSFTINPNQLDVGADRLLDALRAYLPAA